MKQAALIALLAAALFAMQAVSAQDDASPDAADGEQQDSASEPGEAAESVSDDVFIPSEEVQAAEELTFPVDI